jgi:hypothetical protein
METDEQDRREVDTWVRNALMPDSAAAARVAARALAGSRASKTASHRMPFVVLTVAAFALVAVLAGLQWRRGAPAPALPTVPIPGGGPLVVIESPDGRRWIVGRSSERPGGGSYAVVIPESKEVR